MYVIWTFPFFLFFSLSRSVHMPSETNELNRKRERESAVRFMSISLEHSRFVHWKKTGGGGNDDEQEEEEHRWQQLSTNQARKSLSGHCFSPLRYVSSRSAHTGIVLE